ncbi:unnamed protein product, partial [marine sediment metagenome]
GDNAHIRARAREWLARYLIGEPSQLHQLLFREERDITIKVVFGEEGDMARLPAEDIIDVEPVIVETN